MALPAHESGADPLSQILESIRLRSEVLCRSDFAIPWGLAMPALEGMYFHIVERGTCMIKLDDGSFSIQASAGDVVIVPRGDAHTLCQPADAAAVSLETHLSLITSDGAQTASPDTPHTSVICGSFIFEPDPRYRFASLMPPMVRLALSDSGEWLEAVVKLIAKEARSRKPGMEIVLRRLTEALFVESLRTWLERQGEMPASWLAALRDASISRVLAAIHNDPARKWTVTDLASVAGLSRSPFASRFVAHVGVPPLTYLTRWRMHVAARLLQSRDLSVARIAADVGYDSEAAFNRAFKTHHGQTPGAWRKSEL